MRLSISFFLLLFLFSCEQEKEVKEEKKESNPIEEKKPSRLSYTVKMTLPHDPTAFTQGLDFVGDKLYESTGGQGSWIAEVDLSNGKQNKKVVLEDSYFGEGITILNNKVYQITWRNKEGFVYDLKTFKKLKKFNYNTEGWGLTNDNKNIIMSDGSDKLFFLDTTNLNVVKTISVKENGTPIDKLNELELIDNYVFANRWETDFIYKINPETGEVVGRLDFSALAGQVRRETPEVDVLNGIAYNPKTKDILITGKLWPKAFSIIIQ